MVLEFARAQASKQAPGLRHPQLCLDAIQEGIEKGGMAGLKKVRQQGTCFWGSNGAWLADIQEELHEKGGMAGLKKVCKGCINGGST